jgi:hypothetical protein
VAAANVLWRTSVSAEANDVGSAKTFLLAILYGMAWEVPFAESYAAEWHLINGLVQNLRAARRAINKHYGDCQRAVNREERKLVAQEVTLLKENADLAGLALLLWLHDGVVLRIPTSANARAWLRAQYNGSLQWKLTFWDEEV